MNPITLLLTLIQVYSYLIIAYILLSWFPVSGVLREIQGALGTLVEPYLSIFRRFIPPLGMIDISPIVAILVLNAIARLIAGLRF